MGDLLDLILDSAHVRRILASVTLLTAIMLAGTIGYLLLGPAGTTGVDALYMTFITVATIGFSEVVDLQGNAAGRLFTIAIALAGIGTMTYLFSAVTAFVLETNLNRTFWRRRVLTKIQHLNDHYVVCGGGRVGSYVIEELRTNGRRFVVVEMDRETFERHLEKDPALLIIEGDASEDEILEAAGIRRAAGVFAITGDDSKNLVISLSAKQLNPTVRVVARIHDQRNAAKTLRAGADEIVSPDFTGGLRAASLMIRPQMVSLMDEIVRSGGRVAVEEVPVPAGKPSMRVSDLGRSPEWLLIAVRHEEQWQFNPAQDAEIGPGSLLVAIASPAGAADLQARVSA